MVDQVVSHYRVLQYLGAGGMGRIYRAKDLRLGREIALKFLPELKRDRLAVERLEREAQSAAAVNHPNICTVYEIGEHEGTPFIAMELLNGETLGQRASREAIPAEVLLDWAMQIADALEAAHLSGIIHRDLKPSNLFLTTRGSVKILDFGLAKLASDRTNSLIRTADETVLNNFDSLSIPGTVMGTAAYMSPEQVAGTEVDERTDLFALGVVLYELATGRLPFTGKTSGAIMGAILHQAPESPSKWNPALPTRFQEIILKALEKDRGTRYQHASDLRVDLKRLKRDLESSSSASALSTADASAAWRPGTVAVLPFANLGPDLDTDYLSDGLTEEIIDRLGSIPGMRVVARTSAFQFKQKGGDVQEIGRALKAEYLIEGSIRKSQNRIRVNARLVDASTGYQVWSRTYNEMRDDVFSIQAAIADTIAVALGRSPCLSPDRVVKPGLAGDAYHFYLRGRFHRNQWTFEGFKKSIDYFGRALNLEPGSAQLLAALAEAQVMQVVGGHVPCCQQMERARSFAKRALALDDQCAQAHLALGWIHHIYDWQWDSGLAEFDRALEMNPSFAEAWHLKGLFLALRRRVTEAERSFQRAMEFDPLSLVIQAHAALVPYFGDKLGDAELRAQTTLAMDSNFAETHWVLGLICERQGRYREALQSLQKAAQLGGETPTMLGDIGFVHARLGNIALAREIAAQLEKHSVRPHPAASSLARIYLCLGERATSITWLEEAFEARDVMLPWACADPRYEDMWSLTALSGLRQQILDSAVR